MAWYYCKVDHHGDGEFRLTFSTFNIPTRMSRSLSLYINYLCLVTDNVTFEIKILYLFFKI